MSLSWLMLDLHLVLNLGLCLYIWSARDSCGTVMFKINAIVIVNVNVSIIFRAGYGAMAGIRAMNPLVINLGLGFEYVYR